MSKPIFSNTFLPWASINTRMIWFRCKKGLYYYKFIEQTCKSSPAKSPKMSVEKYDDDEVIVETTDDDAGMCYCIALKLLLIVILPPF